MQKTQKGATTGEYFTPFGKVCLRVEGGGGGGGAGAGGGSDGV